jgi:excisionase family DNA binding protein
MASPPTELDGVPSQLLDVKDVARLLGVSPKTVYELIWSGEIGHFRVRRRYRFSLAHVQAFLKDGYEGPVA